MICNSKFGSEQYQFGKNKRDKFTSIAPKLCNWAQSLTSAISLNALKVGIQQKQITFLNKNDNGLNKVQPPHNEANTLGNGNCIQNYNF